MSSSSKCSTPSTRLTNLDIAIERARRESREKQIGLLTTALRIYEAEIRSDEQKKAEKSKRRAIHRERRIWIRPWIQRRNILGGSVLMRELAVEDPKSYTNALRMNSELFNELLGLIESSIQKQNTVMRNALSARLKLEVTLRFLASGDSLKSLSLLFRVPTCTISKFLPEVLRAIHIALAHYLEVPNTIDKWKKIARDFAQVWNFPNCCGAIDGKHVNIKQPPRSGSNFYNYKGYFSTVLLALVDADYNFLYVNVGTNGRSNDAGIFKASALDDALEKGTLNMPDDHVILGDSAFPLKTYLMKPYGHKNGSRKKTVFNYRLSRARRIVENAFGILVWRFRIFTRSIELKVETVDDVVLAACTLHNWLRSRSPLYITTGNVDEEDANTGEIIPGQWRSEIRGLLSAAPKSTNNYTQAAKLIRDEYTNYFWERGAIPAQWKATGINPGDHDVIPCQSDDDDDDNDESDE